MCSNESGSYDVTRAVPAAYWPIDLQTQESLVCGIHNTPFLIQAIHSQCLEFDQFTHHFTSRVLSLRFVDGADVAG